MSNYRQLHSKLHKHYKNYRTLLRYETPFQLLISVILSAQTTDAQVNRVTPRLFENFPGALQLAAAPLNELEEIVHSTGFYKMKAKHIKGAATGLMELFDGEVPSTMEELLKLPGVGRKSANVVLAHCFHKPAIIVDTHFSRVTNRLGLVATKDPKKIEAILSFDIPQELQIDFSMYLNYLGRDFCHARKPDCGQCPLIRFCPSATS